MYIDIEIRKSPIHGKGVFSKHFLKKGLTLTCDVLLVNDNENDLHVYKYPWSFHICSVCIGFGSFFNHSDNPNVKLLSIDKINMTKTFELLSDIEENCELMINYGPKTVF